MNDLEITKRCAEAMGVEIAHVQHEKAYFVYHPIREPIPIFHLFDPLHDDAQAMALVKKFELEIMRDEWYEGDKPVIGWYVQHFVNPDKPTVGEDANLNRAICECVANMAGKG